MRCSSSFASEKRIRQTRAPVGGVFALVALLALVAGCDRRTRAPASGGTALHITVADEDLDADVFVDGNYVGQVGDIQGTAAGPMLLVPGKHRLEVRKDGHFPFQRTIEVDADAPPPALDVQAELLTDPR